MVRIPLIVAGPGVKPRVDPTPVSLIDVGPTVLDLFGLATPGSFLGQSLAPLLRGDQAVVSVFVAVSQADAFEVVQGYAAHEKEVLTRVTEARANVAGMKVTPELVNDPEAMARFQKAQGELSGALSRLLVVSENYPNLKADANFRDLQAQLEGTENRITVARNRYIKAVENYNVSVRTFPNNLTAMVIGAKPKANFTVENEQAISEPPKVNFGSPASAPAPAKTQ